MEATPKAAMSGPVEGSMATRGWFAERSLQALLSWVLNLSAVVSASFSPHHDKVKESAFALLPLLG